MNTSIVNTTAQKSQSLGTICSSATKLNSILKIGPSTGKNIAQHTAFALQVKCLLNEYIG